MEKKETKMRALSNPVLDINVQMKIKVCNIFCYIWDCAVLFVGKTNSHLHLYSIIIVMDHDAMANGTQAAFIVGKLWLFKHG